MNAANLRLPVLTVAWLALPAVPLAARGAAETEYGPPNGTLVIVGGGSTAGTDGTTPRRR